MLYGVWSGLNEPTPACCQRHNSIVALFIMCSARLKKSKRFSRTMKSDLTLICMRASDVWWVVSSPDNSFWEDIKFVWIKWKNVQCSKSILSAESKNWVRPIIPLSFHLIFHTSENKWNGKDIMSQNLYRFRYRSTTPHNNNVHSLLLNKETENWHERLFE